MNGKNAVVELLASVVGAQRAEGMVARALGKG